jgi:hypothetical protein
MVGAISVADGLAVAGGTAVDLLDAAGAGAACVGAAHPVNNRQISIQVKTNFIAHLLSNLV